MTGLVLGGLILVVVLAVVWSRVGGLRSDRRSVKDYEHTLGVLGEVTRRGAFGGEVKPTTHEGEHQPNPGFVDPDEHIQAPAPPQVVEPRGAIWPRIAAPPVAKLSFGDDAVEEAELREPGSDAPTRGLKGRDTRGRHVLGGAAAAAALVAVAVIAAKVVTDSGPHHNAPAVNSSKTKARSSSHTRTPAKHHHSPSSGQTGPRMLTPTSTSPSVVAFNTSNASYTVTFSDTGTEDCWIGVQTAINGSSWLWMTTLVPGQTAQYKATGAVFAKLGAPKNVEVKVDGVPAQLPGFALPYDLSFTPGSTPASA